MLETEGTHCHCEVTEEMLSLIDVLVDGPYVESLHDISLKFRGSSNQRVIDMKKWLLSISAVALSLSMSLSTFGATGTIVNGKTMVPVRGVFEQLGFQVYWEGSSGSRRYG